jgi:NAD+ kinase
MRLESVRIVLNKRKVWAKKLEKEIMEYLLSKGVKIVSNYSAQVLITIGGDGTILYHKGCCDIPVFAIGSHTSFLCHATKHTWKKELSSIVENGFRLEKRTMVSSILDGKKKLPDALNEVAIRNREHRVLDIRLYVGNKKYEFQADGIMFSTATGSRAYAYSCGGVEMPPLSKKIQIVSIAPFRRKFNYLLVSSDARCKVIVDSTCEADAVVDGQYEVPIKKRCTLEAYRAKREFEFVRVIKKREK